MYCKNADKPEEKGKLYDDLINISLSDSELCRENNTISYLIELFESYTNDHHAAEEIAEAYEFADFLHKKPREGKSSKRESGEDYITHPLAVAIILACLYADKDTIIASIFHDILEETYVTSYIIGQRYNQDVMNYVIGVSKIENIGDELVKLSDAEYKRKMVTEGSKDLVILVIKLSDRLHNMRSLYFKKDEDRKKQIALDTINYYAPLADMIGMNVFKDELEDLAFKNIAPEAYDIIDRKIKEEIENRKGRIMETIKFIEDCSKFGNQYEYELKFTKKNIYSIYKKCYNSVTKEVTGLDKIDDLVSVHIIVKDEEKCREVNKLIASAYRVNKDETKDYITCPKTDTFKSLQTTIYDDQNKMIQFQIRTPEMEKLADYGYAAYWELNGHSAKKDMYEASKRNLFKPIHAIDRIYSNDDEFMANFQNEILSEDKITVYTPKGQPIILPAGSTAIDFAYRIHTEVGNELDFAVISSYNPEICNKPYDKRTAEEKIDSLFHPLENGDIVLLAKKGKVTVNSSWLDNTKTKRARKKIIECLRDINDSKISNLSTGANMIEEHKIKELHM